MNIEDKAPELLEIADQLRMARDAIGADQGIEVIMSGGSVMTFIGYTWDGGIKTALVDVHNRKVYSRD